MAKSKLIKIVALAIVLVGAAVSAKYLFFNRPFRYAGTLEATDVDLSAQIASTISAVNVHEGDHVTKNEVLVQLACDDVKVAARLADDNYNRTVRLFKADSVSRATMDEIESKKDEANIRLGWCSIQSPITGTVLSRYHEPGELVGPGVKLLTLANIKDIWAYIYVPEPVMEQLKVGENVTGYMPELNNRAFQGKIVKINDEAEFTPKNVQTQAERSRLVFGVKVSFLGANQSEILKPGMTIEVQLPKAQE